MKLARTIAAVLLFNVLSVINSEASTYTNIPNEFIYTNLGYIWYSQSGSQDLNTIGFWNGFNSTYIGGKSTMNNPTYSGCGPISFAIIASNRLNELITPSDTIQYYCDNGLYTGNGALHNSAIKAAKHYGLSTDVPENQVHGNRNLDQDVEVNWMKNHLEQGHWIQILVKNKPNIKNSIWSYSGGHFVAIHGYIDGNTYIYDSSRKDYLEIPMDLVEVWQNVRHPNADNCGLHHMIAIW